MLDAIFAFALLAAAPDDPPAEEPTADPTEAMPAPTTTPAPTPSPAAVEIKKELPDFLRNKRRMQDADLVDKKEGGYFTGLPLLNSDPDTGIGFGARVLYFNNGPRSDRIFEYTPYRHRLYGQAFFTTNGYQYHTLDYDAPYIGGYPLRLRANLVYEKNTAANYYGAGPRSLGRLRHPGDDKAYASLSEYTESLRRIRPDGTAFTRYNQYILERPSASATLERDFFGGIVRLLGGFSASYVTATAWDNRRISADNPDGSEVDARQGSTRFREDCAADLIKGCEAGFNNALKLGIAFDTRDFEPDPNSGFFVDLTTEISNKAIGSQYDWARLTFSPRAYYSPFPKLTDLVLAGRLVSILQTADTPLYTLSQMSFTDVTSFGLGGLRSIRGYKQNRFVGRAMFLANFEVRWTFYEFTVFKKQHFALMVAPFFDIGRVFDTIDDFEFRRFRNGQGAGFRIAWNQATIVVLDYGISREGSGLYINFNHPF